MDTVIRAASAPDFLALVPHLVGFRPRESLVLVGMRGTRTHRALRVDLPPADAPDAAEAFVHTVVGLVCRLPEVDAVVPVVYTDRPIGRGGGAAFGCAPGWPGEPGTALVDAIAIAAHDAGFRLTDAFCVAADGWFSYLDGERPAGGRPLAELAAALDRFPGEVPELDDPPEACRIPTAPAALIAEVGAALRHRRNGRGPAGAGGRDVLACVALIEEALRARPEDLPAARLAELAELTAAPAGRDAFLLQAAFGPEIGELALDRDLRWQADHRGDSRTADAIVAEEFDAGRVAEEDLFVADLLAGRSRVRPDPARIEHGIALARRIASVLPERMRPVPLVMLGWLDWALGRGTRADRHVAAALELDPDHGFGLLIAAMLAAGHLPEWAFAEE